MESLTDRLLWRWRCERRLGERLSLRWSRRPSERLSLRLVLRSTEECRLSRRGSPGADSCGWRSWEARSNRETRGARGDGAEAEGASVWKASPAGKGLLGAEGTCAEAERKSMGASLGDGRSAGGLGVGCASAAGVAGATGVKVGSGVKAAGVGLACAADRDSAGVVGVLVGVGAPSLAVENARAASLANGEAPAAAGVRVVSLGCEGCEGWGADGVEAVWGEASAAVSFGTVILALLRRTYLEMLTRSSICGNLC